MRRRLNVIVSGKVSNLKLERQVVGRISKNVAKFVLDGRNITYPFLPDIAEITSRKIIQDGDLVTISGESNGAGVLCFAIRDDSSGRIIAKVWWKSFLISFFIMVFDFSIYFSTFESFNFRNILLSPIPKLEIILSIISLYFFLESIRCYSHNKNVEIR